MREEGYTTKKFALREQKRKEKNVYAAFRSEMNF